MQKKVIALCVAMLGLCAFSMRAEAQAAPALSGPGLFLSVGATASAYQADYGKRVLGGYTGVVDLHFRSRYSLEGEARFLKYHTDEGVTEQNFLVGPRVDIVHRGSLRPYAKVLVGAGRIHFPFNYATGGYLAVAPGAGLDIRLNSVITWRAVDAEYQFWPQFTYGQLHPYGISSGIMIRLTRPNLFKRDPYIPDEM